MKTPHLIKTITIGLTSLIIFSSCKKSNTPDIPDSPVSKCKLARATDNVGHISNTFSYDESGRLITLIHLSDYDPYTKHLSYKGDSIISNIDAGVNSSTDTIILNSLGLISSNRQVTSNGVLNASYNYDGSGALTSSSVGSTIVDYTYTNGDNTYQRFTDNGNVTVDTFSYYTDKPAVPIDYYTYNQFLLYGAYYLKNKHLAKSYQSGQNHGNYTYEFDSNGNVTTLYSDFGIGKDTLHFTYTCP
ncbi:MAG TPA: hypothetical protein VFI29_17310 [Hanamia sp.]|nr:hypothetical protein [Hanamia sp.]